MEDTSKNYVLCINEENNLFKKKQKILETLGSNVDVFFFYDTETTGLNPYPKEGGRDRILEVAFIAYYLDENGKFQPLEVDGKPVTFQEYVNPFKESEEELSRTRSTRMTNPKALEVHGITNNFLNGKESLGNVRLPKPAPTFAEMKPFMEDFLCIEEQGAYKANVHFVSFNGKSFDDKMLEEEMKYVDMYNSEYSYKRSFESLASSSIDVKLLMQKLYSRSEIKEMPAINGVKSGHSLDYLSRMMGVDLTSRKDFHGGLLDSVILKDAFEKLLQTDRYNAIHNKYNFNVLKTKETEEIKYQIDPYLPSESNEDGSTLNIIKTDASFYSGTGTIKEYVQKAKQAGLDNLVLADDVSLSRFVEFYQECKKNEIKPIIATNFKLESNFDIYNLFSMKKESSLEARKLMLDVVNQAMGLDGVSFEKLVSEHNLNDPAAWGAAIDKVKAVQGALIDGGKIPTGIAKAISELLSVGGYKTKLKAADYNQIIGSHPSIQEFESFDRISGHSNLLLVAENDEGYETLKKLISVANRDGLHFVDKDLKKGENPLLKIEHLNDFNEGVFAFLGSEDDILDKAIQSGYKTMADGVINNLRSVLGNRISIQISSRADLSSEKSVMADKERLHRLMQVSERHNIPCLAAQSALFANPEDLNTHVNKRAILLDQDMTDFSFGFPETKYDCLQGKTELNELFANNKQALINSKVVIDGIENDIVLNKPTLPEFKTKDGATQAEELTRRAYDGLEKKVKAAFEKREDTKEDYQSFYKRYQERLDYELGVIIDMDFPGYFLIKQQMIQFCHQEGIPVGAGRGSAAGSLVVYSLGITDVDPIEHNLIFERFLNPERKEMPDIDTDIDGEYREQVLNFLRKEYSDYGDGFEGAAYIMTKGTFSAKNTIRMLGKAKGYSDRWCDELSKTISKEPDVKLEQELKANEVLAQRYESEPRTKKFIDEAIELEKNGGRQVSIGKHAGGIVVGNLISQAPITYVQGIPVVQYDKNDIETAGAVKFDLLGLNTLAKLNVALKNIVEMKGFDELSINNIDVDGKNFGFTNFKYDDKETYKLLQSANTSNVFQIESDMFKGLLKLIKPENLDEITATVSLGRPGPLQNNMHISFAESKFDKSKRKEYHPLIDDLLDETHGTIIYQEQVMGIGQKMGGFTMGGADKLRKAMGKKKIEEMEKQKVLFKEGAEKNHVDAELAEDIFQTVEKFAGYGFNKSHAMAYALLTYKMAFLRTHYPTEFMAAILSVDSNENEFKKKIAKDVDSAKEVGLTLFTPKINLSERRFKPGESTAILYGLDGMTGVSDKDKTKIVEERNANGVYESLEDFMVRAVYGKSTMKLIQGGAMDELALMSKPNKESLEFISQLDKIEKKMFKRALVLKEYEVLSGLMGTKDKWKKYKKGTFKEEDIQKGYNDVLTQFKENKNKKVAECLNEESSVLSAYVTAHPMDIGGIKEKIQSQLTNEYLSLDEYSKNEKEGRFTIAGMITDFAYGRISKNGNKYAFVEVSDGTKNEKVFVDNDMFLEVHSNLKKENGIGIDKGEIVAMNVDFYTNRNDELKRKTMLFTTPNHEEKPKQQQRRRMSPR